MFRTLRMTFVISAFTALSVTFLTSLAPEAEPKRAGPPQASAARPPIGAGVRIIDLRRPEARPEAVVVPAKPRRQTAA